MKQILGVTCVVTALAVIGGCQKTPVPVVPAPTQAESSAPAASPPAAAPTILNIEPKPGETIELGGEGTVELEGDSAPPTAEPTPSEGTPVP